MTAPRFVHRLPQKASKGRAAASTPYDYEFAEECRKAIDLPPDDQWVVYRPHGRPEHEADDTPNEYDDFTSEPEARKARTRIVKARGPAFTGQRWLAHAVRDKDTGVYVVCARWLGWTDDVLDDVDDDDPDQTYDT